MPEIKFKVDGRVHTIDWEARIVSYEEAVRIDKDVEKWLRGYRRKLENPELADIAPLIYAWPVGVLPAIPIGGVRMAGQFDWAANWRYLLSVGRLLKGRRGFENLRIVAYWTCPIALADDEGPLCNLEWGGEINISMTDTELGRAFGYKDEEIRRHEERLRDQ